MNAQHGDIFLESGKAGNWGIVQSISAVTGRPLVSFWVGDTYWTGGFPLADHSGVFVSLEDPRVPDQVLAKAVELRLKAA